MRSIELKCRSFTCLSSFLVYWFNSAQEFGQNHIRIAMPVIVWWFIWKERNEARHDNKLIQDGQIMSSIRQFLQFLGQAKSISPSQLKGDARVPLLQFLNIKAAMKKQSAQVLWRKPQNGFFKLNTDASVIKGKVAGGGIVRDGNVLTNVHE